jgi:hypothetical protein
MSLVDVSSHTIWTRRLETRQNTKRIVRLSRLLRALINAAGFKFRVAHSIISPFFLLLSREVATREKLVLLFYCGGMHFADARLRVKKFHPQA